MSTEDTDPSVKQPSRSSRNQDDRNQSDRERTTRKRAASGDGRRTSSRSRDRHADHGSEDARPRRVKGTEAAAMAAQQLLELTGREAEGVIGLHRREDGWDIEVEVVEVRRIPDTTDVLALYEVQVDEDGQLEGYRRLRRYGRGKASEE